MLELKLGMQIAKRRHLSRENSVRWCLLLHSYQAGVKGLSISNAKRKNLIFILEVYFSNKNGMCIGFGVKEDNHNTFQLTWRHGVGVFSVILALLWGESIGYRWIFHKEAAVWC